MKKGRVKESNFGVCKLCLQQRELRNSHIIPELLYKATYDEKHRAIDVNVDMSQVKFSQKGLRERLLCSVCEGHLNILETYFANIWYGKDVTPQGLVDLKSGTFSLQVDYANFKLFHLSILWRASVSTLSYFSRVDLGPYEEGIRQMVLTLNPGDEHQYGVEGWVLLDDERNVVHDVIHFPRKIKSGLYTAYMCMFGGCRWFYFIARPGIKIPNCLKSNGTLTLFLEHFPSSTSMVDIGETLAKQPNVSMFVDDIN